jgi:SAM-dependent methyltransferase
MKMARLYARYVLPALIDLAMRNKAARIERARFVPLARGVVLEVGIGSGLNLPYYSPKIEKLYALEPSAELLLKAARVPTRASFPIVPLCEPAERIPLADGSIDTVVMTWTLCSIADPLAALAEIRRVLVRDGRLIFIEHGRAADAGVAYWQDRLTPIWRCFTGGCHLNRPIETLLAGGGFLTPGIEQSYVPGPRIGAYFYRGVAALNHLERVPAARKNGGGHES